jgi:hypothetical protein
VPAGAEQQPRLDLARMHDEGLGRLGERVAQRARRDGRELLDHRRADRDGGRRVEVPGRVDGAWRLGRGGDEHAAALDPALQREQRRDGHVAALEPDQRAQPRQRAGRDLALVEQLEIAGAPEGVEAVRHDRGRAVPGLQREVGRRIEERDRRTHRPPSEGGPHRLERRAQHLHLLGILEDARRPRGELGEDALDHVALRDLARPLGGEGHARGCGTARPRAW